MADSEERVREALRILTGNGLLLEEEEAIVATFRKLCEHGYGRLEVVVVAGKLDTLHHTSTFKRKEVVPGLRG